MKVVILAGGVGGARLARGFESLDRVDTTIVVNVADDTKVYGLEISPDIDTIVYTLAGVEGPYGWGRDADTWQVMDELAKFGVDTSFRLGDRDLALNLFRTQRLSQGALLSEITAQQASVFGLTSRVIPASDDRIQTRLQLEGDGSWIDFQDYFVTRKHSDAVSSIEYAGISDAHPAVGVPAAFAEADLVVIAPSNPILSIFPIIKIPGIGDVLATKRVAAVSPFIGGVAVKGPAAELMRSEGFDASTRGIIDAYSGLVDHLAVAVGDGSPDNDVYIHETDIMLGSAERSRELAEEVISWTG